jgi:molybdopterin-containing oxidoreductase family iron-sulfur binding subunit
MVPPGRSGRSRSVRCVHRLTETRSSCVWSCPVQARIFGDLNDPESRVNRLIREREGEVLLEEVGTQPSVTYLPPRRRDAL